MPHYEDANVGLEELRSAFPETVKHKDDPQQSKLIQLKSSRADDPKGRAAEVLAVFQQAGLAAPKLNEYMTVPQWYTGLTRSLVTQRASLNWLSLAATPHSTKSLPSWVIDWNSATKEDQHWLDLASLESKTQNAAAPRSATRGSVYDERRDNITNPELSVHGSVMSKVQAFAEPEAGMEEPLAVAKWIICLQECFLGSSREKIIDKLVDAHLILQLRLEPENEPAIMQQQRKNIEIAFDLISELGLAGLNDPAFAKSAYYKGFRDFRGQDLDRSRFETFFVTDDGDSGFCFCSSMEVEDVVTLVKGSDTPFILRPDDLEEGVYTFVGVATIEGLMNSEAWPDDIEDGDLEELILA
ncbi:hypothetical protein DOTSEDRAFT_54753 [Dothistroma septosporum NZE10]|uniref:Uncharacterized protein n=1 Tax=Dothistroma septosporum (strain NZE10 / CBS 128990) TaxID=675120 RepID=N1PID8_DOTSN|nr:hypothetical protein DOTSEDRAFT_54753 [Dothistroma septosporum NZE10]